MQDDPHDEEVRRELIGLTSLGLWRAREEMRALVQKHVRPALPGLARGCDAFLGWGARPSGHRARSIAKRSGKPFLLVEDGFVKGYDPRLREAPHSYILDRTGLYFDTTRPSDFAALVDQHPLSPAERGWAAAMMTRLRAERITKFNNWPEIGVRDAALPRHRPYLLLVDQVAHDASIAGSGAAPDDFERLLRDAADEASGRTLLVRTHPAARRSSPLLQAARRLRIPVTVPEPINPWRLIEEADAVYTISSQIGFEALMAGCPVVSYGRSFFAGRGLTEDRFDLPPLPEASLEQIFTCFHTHYAVYLDLHTRRRTTLEEAVDQAITVREQRARLPHAIVTAGFSPWKRRAVTPFLIGPQGRPRHALSMPSALRRVHGTEAEIAVWGPEQTDGSFLRMEDGFLRSKGLGVNLVMPSSLALDRGGVHYEERRSSDLEALLSQAVFSPDLLARARRLHEALLAGGVTKYNTGGGFEPPLSPEGRLRVLVPGQVETDRSILFGSPAIRTNAALVRAVRERFPQAFIVYRPHPDVSSGSRPGGNAPCDQDMISSEGTVHEWIGWAERVETMTSLTGFEALLRGRAVGVHGAPFYGGWGLTDDMLGVLPRRSRRLTLDELVAGALILYPFYIHPQSRLPCTPERLVAALGANSSRETSQCWRDRAESVVNRAAVKWRDTLRKAT